MTATMPANTDADAVARMAQPPASRTEVVQLCHDYIMSQIAPQIAAVTDNLREDVDESLNRTLALHDEIRKLKLRCAWLE